MGLVFGRAAVMEAQWDAVMTEAYGPEITGGWSRADLVMSSDTVEYPLVTRPEALVVMSQDGLARFTDEVRDDGLILGEIDLVKCDDPRYHPVRALSLAEELGKRVVANSIMIGALAAALPILPLEYVRTELLAGVPPKTVELNEKAFEEGVAQGEAIRAKLEA
jgi:2-oxoglutarate ferredoxin oxidoreductase subunit gamma|tara:strand:- start:3389 stop:3880 length:492 start_codon:yes stop_codon:yes gene_type:complete